mgnify:CR=1 FL=1
MDEFKYLIYQYSSKNKNWYDATNQVDYFKRNKNSWYVKFKGKDDFYHISFDKMMIFDNPKEVSFIEIYYKGAPCYNVKKILLFKNNIYKIFKKNNYTFIAFANELKIVKDFCKENIKAKDIITYYRIALQKTAKNEEDQFLVKQYDNLNSVNDESVLALYLKGKLDKNNEFVDAPLISPFGVNMSQFKALKMVFENKISIIEGPPGTGKTQTILNIISNAIIRNKTVAVVSNNNSATSNVFEKLEKYGYSFMCAPLGNADNVEKFFNEYNPSIPELKEYKVDMSQLKNLSLGLPEYFKKENLKKQYLTLLDEVDLEYKHFLIDNKNVDFSKYKLKNINISPSLVQSLIVKLKEKKKLNFFDRLFIRRKVKLNKKILKSDISLVFLLLQNLYYLSKQNQIKEEISEIDRRLGGQSFNEKVDLYTSISNKYFSTELSKMYTNRNRREYDKKNYKKQFSNFTDDYPIVLSSTYSLAKCTQKIFLFDYLIVDEASQVNMASALLSMNVAKNIIIVGDIKQLPQIDDTEFKEDNEKLLNSLMISKAYSYYGNSIMSSFLSLYGDKIPKQMLKEHYRCAPEIINFCNKEFYDNKLVIYTESRENEICMRAIKTVEGNLARKNPNGTGLYNDREIAEIENLINNEHLEDIGVITPYKCQASMIQEKFGSFVDSSTVHKFQGREKKTIIFSSVINDVNDFVGNDNLINVAVSRAVDKFILITSDKVAKSKTGVLSDLINYISYNQDFGQFEEGKIKSIYDILYSDYEKQLIEFRKKHPSKDFDSENLTRVLLNEIFSETKYKNLSFKMHVSLKDFVKNTNHDLTNDEYKFYMNPNSHADFLIYNKMSKKPLCVIEVDGVSFHEQNVKQKGRDSKKNSILKKNNIPILRLKTCESNEKERIVNFIEDELRA